MKKSILVLSAAMLLFGALAWAQQVQPGYGSAYGPYYSQIPNLTADQQKKLADLETKYLADVQAIDSQIAQKNLELRKLMLATKPDTAAIDKVENEIVKLENNRYSATLNYRNQSRSVLTSEQIKESPYAFYGPGLCPYNGGYGMMGGYGGYGYGGMMGGYGPGYGRGGTGGYGPGWGGGMMRGWGW